MSCKETIEALAAIEVGGRYLAKVSGQVVVVRVTEIREIPPASGSSTSNWRTLIYAVQDDHVAAANEVHDADRR